MESIDLANPHQRNKAMGIVGTMRNFRRIEATTNFGLWNFDFCRQAPTDIPTIVFKVTSYRDKLKLATFIYTVIRNSMGTGRYSYPFRLGQINAVTGI